MNQLPRGWVLTSLGEVANYINGRAFKPYEWKAAGIPIVRIQNLTNSSASFNYTDQQHEEKFRLKNGDLLIAWSASLGAFIWSGGEAWLNQHIFRAEPFENAVIKEFLYYAVTVAIRDLYDKAHGTGMVHVTKPVFESHPIPIPPLKEQRRIVAKLDRLLARVKAAQERLATIPHILKRFRQSVLDAATKGSLIGDLKKKGDEWNKITLKQITSELVTGPFGSALHKSDYIIDGIPVVNPMNILNGKIVPSRGATVDESIKNRLSRYVLKTADIVVARRGELGRCALVTEKEAGWVCGTGSAILRPNLDIAIPKFVQLVISSPASRLYLNEGAVGSTMANLNQRVFLALPLVLPSLAEQREIVRRVEGLFKTANEMEARYLKAKAHVDKLTQSILAKAFRGELVPQDPNDEPASVLLERITAERNGSAPLRRRSRK